MLIKILIIFIFYFTYKRLCLNLVCLNRLYIHSTPFIYLDLYIAMYLYYFRWCCVNTLPSGLNIISYSSLLYTHFIEFDTTIRCHQRTQFTDTEISSRLILIQFYCFFVFIHLYFFICVSSSKQIWRDVRKK